MSVPPPAPPPATMKAAIRTGWLGTTLDFGDDLPTPPPFTSRTHDRLWIKVHAAALNPVDYKLPRAILGNVYGLDLCGTVVQASPDATTLQVGDVVMGPVVMGWSGSLAEYAVGYASKMVKLPANWSVQQGAAFPIACATALEGFEQAGILSTTTTTTTTTTSTTSTTTTTNMESMLVIGSSGGCGLLALQLAKGLGIPRIVGICSQQNADLCQANGATEIVAYDDPTAFESFLNDNGGQLNVIYDTASYSGAGEDYCDNPRVLALLSAPQGRTSTRKRQYIMLNGSKYQKVKNATLSLGLGISFQKSMIVLPKFRSEGLTLGVQLLERAKLKPMVDASSSDFAFTKQGVQDAYAKLKSRRSKGKIVITISEPEA